MAMMYCPECGKEVSDKATSCPNCGFPISITNSAVNIPSKKKGITKIIIPIILIIVLLIIIGIVIFNVKVVQPQKIESQKNETYEEAIKLLENGKYEEGEELLQTIDGYKDVNDILEEIKWESKVLSCINILRESYKNPDSIKINEVKIYDNNIKDLPKKFRNIAEDMVDIFNMNEEPVIYIHASGENGFGGFSSSYFLFDFNNGEYETLCYTSSLDTKEVTKDYEKDAISIIGDLEEFFIPVETFDIERIRTVIKNDCFSTIKIIE